jgi:hypothetical protein
MDEIPFTRVILVGVAQASSCEYCKRIGQYPLQYIQDCLLSQRENIAMKAGGTTNAPSSCKRMRGVFY